MKVLLQHVAHTRSGDKGNTSNIAVIAYEPELYPLLKEQLTHTGAHIVADSNIAEGGCVIKAGSSEIDASMGVRWRRVLEAIGIKAKEWLPNP